MAGRNGMRGKASRTPQDRLEGLGREIHRPDRAERSWGRSRADFGHCRAPARTGAADGAVFRPAARLAGLPAGGGRVCGSRRPGSPTGAGLKGVPSGRGRGGERAPASETERPGREEGHQAGQNAGRTANGNLPCFFGFRVSVSESRKSNNKFYYSFRRKQNLLLRKRGSACALCARRTGRVSRRLHNARAESRIASAFPRVHYAHAEIARPPLRPRELKIISLRVSSPSTAVRQSESPAYTGQGGPAYGQQDWQYIIYYIYYTFARAPALRCASPAGARPRARFEYKNLYLYRSEAVRHEVQEIVPVCGYGRRKLYLDANRGFLHSV